MNFIRGQIVNRLGDNRQSVKKSKNRQRRSKERKNRLSLNSVSDPCTNFENELIKCVDDNQNWEVSTQRSKRSSDATVRELSEGSNGGNVKNPTHLTIQIKVPLNCLKNSKEFIDSVVNKINFIQAKSCLKNSTSSNSPDVSIIESFTSKRYSENFIPSTSHAQRDPSFIIENCSEDFKVDACGNIGNATACEDKTTIKRNKKSKHKKICSQNENESNTNSSEFKTQVEELLEYNKAVDRDIEYECKNNTNKHLKFQHGEVNAHIFKVENNFKIKSEEHIGETVEAVNKSQIHIQDRKIVDNLVMLEEIKAINNECHANDRDISDCNWNKSYFNDIEVVFSKSDEGESLMARNSNEKDQETSLVPLSQLDTKIDSLCNENKANEESFSYSPEIVPNTQEAVSGAISQIFSSRKKNCNPKKCIDDKIWDKVVSNLFISRDSVSKEHQDTENSLRSEYVNNNQYSEDIFASQNRNKFNLNRDLENRSNLTKNVTTDDDNDTKCSLEIVELENGRMSLENFAENKETKKASKDNTENENITLNVMGNDNVETSPNNKEAIVSQTKYLIISESDTAIELPTKVKRRKNKRINSSNNLSEGVDDILEIDSEFGSTLNETKKSKKNKTKDSSCNIQPSQGIVKGTRLDNTLNDDVISSTPNSLAKFKTTKRKRISISSNNLVGDIISEVDSELDSTFQENKKSKKPKKHKTSDEYLSQDIIQSAGLNITSNDDVETFTSNTLAEETITKSRKVSMSCNVTEEEDCNISEIDSELDSTFQENKKSKKPKKHKTSDEYLSQDIIQSAGLNITSNDDVETFTSNTLAEETITKSRKVSICCNVTEEKDCNISEIDFELDSTRKENKKSRKCKKTKIPEKHTTQDIDESANFSATQNSDVGTSTSKAFAKGETIKNNELSSSSGNLLQEIGNIISEIDSELDTTLKENKKKKKSKKSKSPDKHLIEDIVQSTIFNITPNNDVGIISEVDSELDSTFRENRKSKKSRRHKTPDEYLAEDIVQNTDLNTTSNDDVETSTPNTSAKEKVAKSNKVSISGNLAEGIDCNISEMDSELDYTKKENKKSKKTKTADKYSTQDIVQSTNFSTTQNNDAGTSTSEAFPEMETSKNIEVSSLSGNLLQEIGNIISEIDSELDSTLKENKKKKKSKKSKSPDKHLIEDIVQSTIFNITPNNDVGIISEVDSELDSTFRENKKSKKSRRHKTPEEYLSEDIVQSAGPNITSNDDETSTLNTSAEVTITKSRKVSISSNVMAEKDCNISEIDSELDSTRKENKKSKKSKNTKILERHTQDIVQQNFNITSYKSTVSKAYSLPSTQEIVNDIISEMESDIDFYSKTIVKKAKNTKISKPSVNLAGEADSIISESDFTLKKNLKTESFENSSRKISTTQDIVDKIIAETDFEIGEMSNKPKYKKLKDSHSNQLENEESFLMPAKTDFEEELENFKYVIRRKENNETAPESINDTISEASLSNDDGYVIKYPPTAKESMRNNCSENYSLSQPSNVKSKEETNKIKDLDVENLLVSFKTENADRKQKITTNKFQGEIIAPEISSGPNVESTSSSSEFEEEIPKKKRKTANRKNCIEIKSSKLDVPTDGISSRSDVDIARYNSNIGGEGKKSKKKQATTEENIEVNKFHEENIWNVTPTASDQEEAIDTISPARTDSIIQKTSPMKSEVNKHQRQDMNQQLKRPNVQKKRKARMDSFQMLRAMIPDSCRSSHYESIKHLLSEIEDKTADDMLESTAEIDSHQLKYFKEKKPSTQIINKFGKGSLYQEQSEESANDTIEEENDLKEKNKSNSLSNQVTKATSKEADEENPIDEEICSDAQRNRKFNKQNVYNHSETSRGSFSSDFPAIRTKKCITIITDEHSSDSDSSVADESKSKKIRKSKAKFGDVNGTLGKETTNAKKIGDKVTVSAQLASADKSKQKKSHKCKVKCVADVENIEDGKLNEDTLKLKKIRKHEEKSVANNNGLLNEETTDAKKIYHEDIASAQVESANELKQKKIRESKVKSARRVDDTEDCVVKEKGAGSKKMGNENTVSAQLESANQSSSKKARKSKEKSIGNTYGTENCMLTEVTTDPEKIRDDDNKSMDAGEDGILQKQTVDVGRKTKHTGDVESEANKKSTKRKFAKSLENIENELNASFSGKKNEPSSITIDGEDTVFYKELDNAESQSESIDTELSKRKSLKKGKKHSPDEPLTEPRPYNFSVNHHTKNERDSRILTATTSTNYECNKKFDDIEQNLINIGLSPNKPPDEADYLLETDQYWPIFNSVEKFTKISYARSETSMASHSSIFPLVKTKRNNHVQLSTDDERSQSPVSIDGVVAGIVDEIDCLGEKKVASGAQFGNTERNPTQQNSVDAHGCEDAESNINTSSETCEAKPASSTFPDSIRTLDRENKNSSFDVTSEIVERKQASNLLRSSEKIENLSWPKNETLSKRKARRNILSPQAIATGVNKTDILSDSTINKTEKEVSVESVNSTEALVKEDHSTIGEITEGSGRLEKDHAEVENVLNQTLSSSKSRNTKKKKKLTLKQKLRGMVLKKPQKRKKENNSVETVHAKEQRNLSTSRASCRLSGISSDELNSESKNSFKVLDERENNFNAKRSLTKKINEIKRLIRIEKSKKNSSNSLLKNPFSASTPLNKPKNDFSSNRPNYSSPPYVKTPAESSHSDMEKDTSNRSSYVIKSSKKSVSMHFPCGPDESLSDLSLSEDDFIRSRPSVSTVNKSKTKDIYKQSGVQQRIDVMFTPISRKRPAEDNVSSGTKRLKFASDDIIESPDDYSSECETPTINKTMNLETRTNKLGTTIQRKNMQERTSLRLVMKYLRKRQRELDRDGELPDSNQSNVDGSLEDDSDANEESVRTMMLDVLRKIKEKEKERSRRSPRTKMALNSLHIVENWNIPLSHRIETRLSCSGTKEQNKLFQSLDVPLKTGTFSAEEDERIYKNFRRFCKEYGLAANPEPFLHLTNNLPLFIPSSEKIKFVQYIGRGLENRKLWIIFKRFCTIFQNKKSGRFFPDEDAVILTYMRLFKDNVGKFADLEMILNRERVQIAKRYTYVTNGQIESHLNNNKGKFIRNVMRATRVQNVDDLKNRKIKETEWLRLSKKYNGVSVRTLKYYWLRNIYTKLFSDEPIDINSILRKVVERIHHLKIDSRQNLDWEELCRPFENVTPQFVQLQFKRLVNKYITRTHHGLPFKYVIKVLLKLYSIKGFLQHPIEGFTF